MTNLIYFGALIVRIDQMRSANSASSFRVKNTSDSFHKLLKRKEVEMLKLVFRVVLTQFFSHTILNI